MSSYVVLARKWRPAQFSDIVGQGHIVRTLVNAIQAERIHQAYLFTGSRGIGKTSIARIFAKVLRCESVRKEGDTLYSCDQCSSCREITASSSVDVIEIDGASNNGVEAVREIRESAKFLPSVGSRKIYIIDEVHMLSTAAFNALLKTLEEPPPHVVFIFATTEPHKIPATILSRCQRFDYRRVTLNQIHQRLTQVTLAEKITAEPGALTLIARASEGSMRDALSLLDQVVAFSGNTITTQSARESIGLVENQVVLGLLKSIFQRKPLEALALVDQDFQSGHDLRILTRSLIEFIHGAILSKVGAPAPSSLELSEEEWTELKTISETRELEEIEMIFQVFHQGLEWIARSPQPKIVLDILLIKCATAEMLSFISDSTPAPAQGHGQSQAKVSVSVTPTPHSFAPAVAPAVRQTAQPAVVVSTTTAAVAPAAVSIPGAPNWESFILHVRKTRPLLATILEHGTHSLVTDPGKEAFIIYFPQKNEHYRDQLQSRVYQDQLMTFVKEHFGKSLRIQIETRDTGESLAEKREKSDEERRNQARDAVNNHPIIREAKSLFGGEFDPIEFTDPDKKGDHS